MKKTVLVFLVLISIIFTATYYFLNYFKNPDKITPQTPEISPPKVEVTQPNPNPDWITYTNTNFSYSNSVYSGYSFNYPSNCSLERDYILTCPLSTGNFVLSINATGHGGPEGNYQVLAGNETKEFSSIIGSFTAIKDLDNDTIFGTYWINQTDILNQEPIFGFEFGEIPATNYAEFLSTFDQILSSLKFSQ